MPDDTYEVKYKPSGALYEQVTFVVACSESEAWRRAKRELGNVTITKIKKI